MPRRSLGGLSLACLLAALLVAAQPSPEAARANVVCDLGGGVTGGVSGGIEAITGAGVGGGNPLGDTCNAVSDGVGGIVKNPVSAALEGVGNGIFEQITDWASEGAGWLIGEVVKGINETTTPKLTSKGFLAEYGSLAQIAALFAMAMLLLAVLEGVAQGNAGMLARVVLVNLPLAFIATSVAYVVVQLLLLATDGLCHAIASMSHESGRDFFKGAIAGLGTAGREIGSSAGSDPLGGVSGEATGAASVPLFVAFLAAIIGAFAAFLVWVELLMRDAAVYVVALFMPFSLAAAIWPRWAGVLRRTGELLVVVIGSKLVIVAIISLAAGLVAEPEERVEAILAASALMLLACFAPFVLLKLVPFAEGAMSAAYSRRSSAGGVAGGFQIASNVQMVRNMARSNWGDSGVTLWEAAEKEGGAPGPAPGGPHSGGSGSGGGGSGGGGRGGSGGGGGGGGPEAVSGGAGPAGAAAAAPTEAARGAEAASERLGETATAKHTDTATSDPASTSGQTSSEQPAGGSGSAATGTESQQAGEEPPRPAPERPGARPEKEPEQ